MIDSNEDGFTENNIKAICSVGMSTKTSIQGYIGEKGIGFKSVFKIAQKVHVQSGAYSFAFDYQPDDPNDGGLGMVTPINEDHLDIPDGVRTRMILYLQEKCDRADLRKQFLELPDTLLLFLKKLKQLSIQIELPNYNPFHVQYSLKSHGSGVSGKIVSIEKTLGGSVSTQNFWIKRRQVTDMPSNTERRNVHTAEVVLGFPLDESETPVIENQHVFAFLPVKKVGFKVSETLNIFICKCLAEPSEISSSSNPISSLKQVEKMS